MKFWRSIWRLILLAHAAAAGVFLWRRPGGFSGYDIHFWQFIVVPGSLIALVVITFIFARRIPAIFGAAIVAIAALWTSAALSMRLVFPITGAWFWLPILLIGALLWVIAQPALRGLRTGISSILAASILSSGISAFVIAGQRSPSAHTHPLNVSMPANDSAPAEPDPRPIRLGKNILITRTEGAVEFNIARLHISLHPLLTFDARSPDRCWTILPPRDRQGPPRRLLSVTTEPDRARLSYFQDGAQSFDVQNISPAEFHIEALSHLPWPIFSHLNSFCEMEIAGHRTLSISFSPCASARLDVEPMDETHPRRLAYLDDTDVFHVVEAHQEEKGPFRELARGILHRGDPLTLTFYDDAKPVMKLTLDDWTRQLSTAPSPTAGWNLPENAIEFNLEGYGAAAPATFFFELAATSVGRGLATVGHAPGVYRNRIKIQTINTPTTQP